MNNKLKDFLVVTVFRVASIINKIIPKNQYKILLYENNVGFDDNNRAICEYMISKHFNTKFKIIVSVNKLPYERLPDNIKIIGNLGGVINFFTSGHVFYCHGKIPIYPAKRQIVVQMWHGTPFKGNNRRQKKSVTKIPYYTYFLSSSPYFEKIIIDNFYVKKQNIALCGQPRTDVFFEDNKLPDELIGFTKVIMWMPTYRMSSIQGDVDVRQTSIIPIFNIDDFGELEQKLMDLDVCLLIKLHPLQDLDLFKRTSYKHIIFLCNDDFRQKKWELYRILSKTDALVTDYSSVFYDYMLLDRPIGFAIDDIKEYKSSRGFVVENPDYFMAGEKIKSKDEFYQFIQHVVDGIDIFKEQRNQVNRITHTYIDGNNCKRALDIGDVRLP